MHSIRIKITAITILAILVSVVTLGAIGVLALDAESDQDSVEKMGLISDDGKRILDSYFDSLKQSVEMASNVTDDSLAEYGEMVNGAMLLGVVAPGQQEQVDQYLMDRRSVLQKTFDGVASNTNGVVTYYYCVNPNVCAPEYGFFYSKVGKSDFEEEPYLDAATLDPNDLEHFSWYFTPKKQGKPCWIGPYQAHFIDEVWMVSYVIPVYHDGVFLGVLGMDILLDTLLEHIQAANVYQTGFIALLDSDGRVLYHPELEYGSELPGTSQLAANGFFKQGNSGTELVRYNVNNQERQLAFSTLSNGVKLAVIAPVDEIEASNLKLTRAIILAAFLILAVFTALTLFFMTAVTLPLRRLTVASQRLAAGDYDVELDYDGDDEVGVLTRSFRQMRDKLKQRIDDLNVQVTTDTLTGIKNRGAFDAVTHELNKVVAESDGEEVPQFAFVMFDCNRLKVINDEYGHDKGDIYLRTASVAICQVFKHSPVFRVGGDEFAVVLQGQDFENREELLEVFDQKTRDINAAAENPWDMVDIAMGMAEFQPDADADAEQTLRRADELMYLDKRLTRLAREDPSVM